MNLLLEYFNIDIRNFYIGIMIYKIISIYRDSINTHAVVRQWIKKQVELSYCLDF